MSSIRSVVLTLAVAFALPCAARATEFTIEPSESVFAVVVHKAGIAARFAHNHFIAARDYTATITIEGGDPTTAAFSLEAAVADLEVDASEAHEKWYPEIVKAGILDEPFGKLSEKDRKTIAEHMLAKDQLDGAQCPTISAKVVKIRAERNTFLKRDYTHMVSLDLTVHGKTVRNECPADIVLNDGELEVNAAGAFRFSDFGIKPYSTMMGAVKNQDEFHVFVQIRAAATREEERATK